MGRGVPSTAVGLIFFMCVCLFNPADINPSAALADAVNCRHGCVGLSAAMATCSEATHLCEPLPLKKNPLESPTTSVSCERCDVLKQLIDKLRCECDLLKRAIARLRVVSMLSAKFVKWQKKKWRPGLV